MIILAVGGYTHIIINNLVRHKIVYSSNGNNLTKTFISLHNNANTSEKSI